MKLTISLLLMAGLSLAQTKKATPKAKPAAAAPADVTIPAAAVPTEDGSFRYTDAQGKKWLYRKTPFGISKVEDKPPVAPDPSELVDERTSAVANGDMIHFERPTPFGVTKWDKKKTELDASEQKIWERQKEKADAKRKQD